MEILYSAQAVKDLKRIPKGFALAIVEKVKQYAKDPESLQNMVKKLQGLPYWRLRVGDYRVIFGQDGKVLRVEKIGHRKEVYR